MLLNVNQSISKKNSANSANTPLDLDSLIAMGGLNSVTAEILRKAIINRQNILIVGAISAGKTVLLQALTTELQKLATEDKLGIIQAVEEVRSDAANHTSFAYPLLAEEMPLGKLTRAALRMRPDRIIVGDIYHDEATILLNCDIPWFATIVGTTIENGIHNLEQFSNANGYKVSKSQIGEEIDIVVLVKKVKGEHKVTMVSQFSGYDKKHDIIEQIQLFTERTESHEAN